MIKEFLIQNLNKVVTWRIGFSAAEEVQYYISLAIITLAFLQNSSVCYMVLITEYVAQPVTCDCMSGNGDRPFIGKTWQGQDWNDAERNTGTILHSLREFSFFLLRFLTSLCAQYLGHYWTYWCQNYRKYRQMVTGQTARVYTVSVEWVFFIYFQFSLFLVLSQYIMHGFQLGMKYDIKATSRNAVNCKFGSISELIFPFPASSSVIIGDIPFSLLD